MSEPETLDELAKWAKDRKAPLYPVTITAARYGGTYEGGSWTAFNLYSHQIPAGADDSDIECAQFWRSPAADRVGRGQSPGEALADLVERVGIYGEYEGFRGDARK